MTLQTGFIGLGSQGGPMAERMLAEGFPLMVWARRAEALEPFVAQGATTAESIAALGSACDHVGLCVVDDAGVAAVCDDLIPAMKPGSLLAVHSTILPESCEALEKRCADRGVLFLDAPVSGGGQGAAAKTLTVMCGGSPEALAQARPVFESFAGLLVHLGPAGAGQRAKIVNNTLLAANMGLAQAALGAGEALGIEGKALAELIKASSGRSYGLEIFARLRSPAAFALGAPLLAKDTNLLRDILPGHWGAETLRDAAERFLSEATGKPL
ncbi:MAG: NAD(P)-dependent oxidoreductase [Novosphingobium sp.]